MDSRKYKSRGGAGAIRCKNGTAEVVPGDALNTFRCKNVRTLYSKGPVAHAEQPVLTRTYIGRLLRLCQSRRSGQQNRPGLLFMGMDESGRP
jgi:hypothetical protein